MNSDFERYKKLCIDKIVNWTVDSANNYHNNIEFPKDMKNNKSLFDDTEEYYVTWRDSNCVFVDKRNCNVYKLCTKFMYYKDDWEKFVDLHSIGIGSMRTDIPLHCEHIEHYNPHHNNVETWEYTVVHRPNRELGRFFIEDMASETIDTDYFIQFVDDSYILLENIKKVHEKYKTGVPSNVSIFRRIHDSLGPYWIDFKRWKYTYESQYDKFLHITNLNMDGVINNGLATINKDTVLDYAKNKLKPLFD